MTTTVKNKGLQTYNEVETRDVPTLLTGNEKIDTFASNDGGFVIGSAIFFTGTSGAGKTTFSVLMQKWFKDVKSALYSREMEAGDVKAQTARLGINHENALIADKSMCSNIDLFIEAIDVDKPKVVIVDSLQVLMKEDCNEGKMEQELWDLISKLRTWTSKNDAVLFVIGHVNKDGSFEGPNTTKQMFDAHLHMDFDQKKNERVLSWTKNRKGSTTVKRYYEFTENDMVFYTEEEWAARAGSASIMSVMDQVLKGFVSSLNKNHPAYNEFASELKSELKEIRTMSDDEQTAQTFLLVNRLTLKHGLIAA